MGSLLSLEEVPMPLGGEEFGGFTFKPEAGAFIDLVDQVEL